MTTAFSTLPIVDVGVLSEVQPKAQDVLVLTQKLYDVFTTVGFAYLVNAPLTFTHADIFGLASDFFRLEETEKLRLATKTSVPSNSNTYRGYFPFQPGCDSLKEGFEIGPAQTPGRSAFGKTQRYDLTEPNVWPAGASFHDGRVKLERLHAELQKLASTLLLMLGITLGKPADYFAPYLLESLSTLRLLHYPPQESTETEVAAIKLCCTPHTDSGILTLLHQDQTGGLEVLNAEGRWIAAPYVPGSIVVNIGDLMARVSGGRFVATMHRVRTSPGKGTRKDGLGRFSVPFFFEPGEACLIRSIDGGEGVVYGEYVRRKMGTWLEYQSSPTQEPDATIAVSAGIVKVAS
ncbi:hypothetical protein BAUCODRAFT_418564 [Baudoinia panamericana UAMH 10762]|uniref:Fe2OG dioxygenase domain-containing protein n=1 Tax=Baudoinia panamericana (strain UAMH 10762) TaxID=717646 RepID=M2N2R9_BAUPA|nr:uncharacterized protein BAUCODRAFT_418564 [Baudoinia panamericana UAMH 10762]EMC98243.1 hypothetical protein BAUCODRAFT_418564 [Baudoinia panamericana UAMH 10762]